MGYIKHHTIVVTCWNEENLIIARKKAIDIFNQSNSPFGKYGDLVSPIIYGIVNGQSSFFIAPDGSKEGWEPSNLCNNFRTEFLDWLKSEKDNIYCDYVEIIFGGDDEFQEIVRSSNEKYEKEKTEN